MCRGLTKLNKFPARRRSSLLLAGLSMLSPSFSTVARAQPQPPSPPSQTSPSTAISLIAETITRQLAGSPGRVLVTGASLGSDAPTPRGAQLVATVIAQIQGRLGPSARGRSEPMPLAAARNAARGELALLHLTLEIAAGKLRVSADVFPVPRTVWARLRNPEPGPIAHAFTEAPLDAEVRTFLAPIPLAIGEVTRAKNFESDVVALGCGDLDQDGAPEVISVGRRRVSIVRLRGGRVVPLYSRNWPELSPVAPAPLREPIGFATVVTARSAITPPFVDVALTDRSRSVRLDSRLRVLGEFPGVALPSGSDSACAHVTSLAISGALVPCTPGDPSPRLASLGARYDAFASARLVSKSGSPYVVWAGREHGALEVRDDAGHKAVFDNVGAQIAVGDLNQDGDPEILTSVDTENPLDDAVVVRSWARTPASSGTTTKEVLRLPAAAGVRAIAVCPPDGPGPTPFVVATTDEIWVVR